MIEIKNLNVKRGNKVILHNLNFTALAGNLTTIIGPNGSGKTTLIKALSGDLKYSGVIQLNGKDIASETARHLALQRAILPQSTALSFPFLVNEVVKLGLSADVERLQKQKYLPELALERVDLAGYGNRYYQELSGGEQARVQLARVLCQIWSPSYNNNPCWLLLDEPVASLDIRHQLVVMDIARDFANRGGGVVTILHDLNLASHYSDKIVLLHQGSISYEGTPREVLTTENLRNIYQCNLSVGTIPADDVPFILPQSVFTPQG